MQRACVCVMDSSEWIRSISTRCWAVLTVCCRWVAATNACRCWNAPWLSIRSVLRRTCCSLRCTSRRYQLCWADTHACSCPLHACFQAHPGAV